MKRLFLTIAILLPTLLFAQKSINEGESVITYSLPKTQFVVEVVSEKITEIPGQFYQYSERFLATKDVITKPKTYYKLREIKIKTTTLPDETRTYQIVPSKRSLASNISVNDKGILCGLNIQPTNDDSVNEEVILSEKKSQESKKLLPLNEEYMFAGSVAKMAEGAAKQIYRIRENRVDLLSGDVENMPLDGSSLKTFIQQMDEQEAELTKLFVGKVEKETVSQFFAYIPTHKADSEVLFRFSDFNGLVSAEDLSGTPYYLTLNFEEIKIVPKEKKRSWFGGKDEEIFVLLPITATVKIESLEDKLFEDNIVIPQLGVVIPMPIESIDKYSRVFVSPKTGRLLTIEQNRKK